MGPEWIQPARSGGGRRGQLERHHSTGGHEAVFVAHGDHRIPSRCRGAAERIDVPAGGTPRRGRPDLRSNPSPTSAAPFGEVLGAAERGQETLAQSEDCPMYLKSLLPTVVLAAAFATPLAGAEPVPVPNFILKDLSGRDWSLHQQKNNATVVVFLSCECPMSNAYAKPIGELAAKYKDRDVAVVAVNASREES